MSQPSPEKQTSSRHVLVCICMCVCVCVCVCIDLYLCVCIFVYVFLCRQTQGKCVNEHISVSKIYFKELAYTFTDSVKSRVCTVGQLTEASEKR